MTSISFISITSLVRYRCLNLTHKARQCLTRSLPQLLWSDWLNDSCEAVQCCDELAFLLIFKSTLHMIKADLPSTMRHQSIGERLLHVVRWLVDLFCSLIGLYYPTKRNYLPPIDDSILTQPAIQLADQIRSGKVQLSHQFNSFTPQLILQCF